MSKDKHPPHQDKMKKELFGEHSEKHEVTFIPKDCLLCDVCNEQLTDEKFIALSFCFWYRGWLYCSDCNRKYKPQSELEHIMDIHKGQDLSKTELAAPMRFESW